MIWTLQYLRALAALMVVFHHAGEQLAPHGQLVLPVDAGVGQAGVDIFFVLSGFIMVYITHGRSGPEARSGARSGAKSGASSQAGTGTRIGPRLPGPLAFWRDRAIRVVPIYWIYTGLMVAIVLAAPGLVSSAVFDPLHVLTSYLFIAAPHPRFEGFAWPVLLQGWTQNFEMVFYALFGLSLVLRSALWGVVATTLALCALILWGVAQGAGSPPVRPVLVFYTHPLFLEFAAGMGLGLAYLGAGRLGRHLAGYMRGHMWGLGWLALALGTAGLVASALAPGYALWRVVEWGMPAMLIVLGCLMLEPRAPRLRGPRLLGDVSYSLYLSHTFVLAAFGVVWGRLPVTGLWLDLGMLVAMLAAAAVTGILSFLLLEEPLTRWLRRRLRGPPPRPRQAERSPPPAPPALCPPLRAPEARPSAGALPRAAPGQAPAPQDTAPAPWRQRPRGRPAHRPQTPSRPKGPERGPERA